MTVCTKIPLAETEWFDKRDEKTVWTGCQLLARAADVLRGTPPTGTSPHLASVVGLGLFWLTEIDTADYRRFV